VAKALNVAAKKFPALADSAAFTENDQVLALIDPARLAELMRGEIFQAAPEYQAENFLGVTDFLFTPRLNALAAYAPRLVSFRAGRSFFGHASHGWEWYSLRWDSLEEAKTGNISAATGADVAAEAIRP